MTDMITYPGIEKKILAIRGRRVMLDADLAELYGVETRSLKQAVRRNAVRFPSNFMFELIKSELDEVITICDNPDRFRFSPVKPLVFTEHGVLMLANVLRSERAIRISIEIIEAFIRLRSTILASPDLAKKIADIESKLSGFQTQLDIFHGIILPLLELQEMKKRKIGFEP
jgi:hypothetical protein